VPIVPKIKLIQQIQLRNLLMLMVSFYLLACTFSVLAVYQAQNNHHTRVEVLGFNDQQLANYANKAALLNLNGGRLTLLEEKGARQLAIVNSRWYLSFQQPVYLVFTSLLFFIFTFLFVITGSVVCRNMQQKLAVALKPVQKLENWANLTVIQGFPNEIVLDEAASETDVITIAIHQLQQQIHDNVASDISSDQSIRASALLDQETHIGNRAFFDNRLQAFLKEDDAQGAVLLIQFKEMELLQSLYGYQQAMSLLLMLIQVTKQRLQAQPSYFLARRSDYELSVLLPGVFIQEVKKLADRLLNNLQKVVTPVGINQEEFIHIGVSYFGHVQAPYQIMSEADMALRSAQLQGPSQWFMFEAGELENVQAKGSLKWRTFLNSAIVGNSFVIFFQPVIASDNAKVLHHEVLSKVRDKDGALISARVFLPMAKKCGLTVKIDLLILEQVCRVLAYEKKPQDDCSINVSIDSLLSEDFSEKYLSILTKFPEVKPRLMIEISEYHLVNHLNELKPVIAKLTAAGIKIVADKVGQYVVSANYLNIYPIFAMKLHRSIVIDIDKKIENQVFIQSLKTLAAPKNIAIYALGVEKQAEWRILLQLGLKGGQGHFFTEPVAQVAKAIHLD
jgi:RNase E specificity factor CsrD